MRKLLVFCGFVLFTAGFANAQETPTVDVAGAYQYIRLPNVDAPNRNCQGFDGNAAFNVNRWVGIVGDFGFCAATGLPPGLSSHFVNYLFGPRVNFRSHSRITPYAQFLLGGDHNSNHAPGISLPFNTFAFTIGAGADVLLTPRLSFRAVQVEYLHTSFLSTQNNLRIETGLVYHFGRK